MRKIILGKTGLTVTKVAFGALPVQRLNMEDGVHLLRTAYERGINFFDTARAYSDSEEKMGNALADVRKDIVIATKTMSFERDAILRDIETSLKMLKTDYIDIYQYHNPSNPPLSAEEDVYKVMLELKEQGVINHIGVTAHKTENAIAAAKSGLYATVQYPLSCLSDERDMDVIRACEENGLGIIGMKAMSGGLISRAMLSFAFLDQFNTLAPIWGIQRMSELEEFLELDANPPKLDEELWKEIEKERASLSGSFCRGCGYCMPGCPQEIKISTAARLRLMMERSPWKRFVQPDWQAEMDKIDGCIDCGQCTTACPYSLDTPTLLRENLAWYREFVKANS